MNKPIPCPPPPRPIFITLEGIDGAGKSTHIAALEAGFIARGRSVVVTREPGGTPLAENLRQLLLGQEMDALTEAMIVCAARRDHVCQVIKPALDEGQVVISDRFTDASFAYQCGGRGLAWETLLDLERISLDGLGYIKGNIKPDLTLWFVLDPAVAAQRRSSARAPDRFEAQDEEFFRAVAQGYERRFAENQRFAAIDAAAAPEQVWEQIERVLLERGLW